MITVSRAVGCTVPGYASQVRHATQGWSAGGRTDIDDLTEHVPSRVEFR